MTDGGTTDRPQARMLRWLDYRAVWRWHFYAGVICIPFVIWLACTGAIYLFKSEIEAWIDRPFDHLTLTGNRAEPSQHVAAALAVVPGSRLNSYELPASPASATRVLVGRGRALYRVYVHPETLAVMAVVREDSRLMRRIFNLHGDLMLGDRGSMVVEFAASWTIVMILTGLYLWWPRKHRGAGGVVYPRLTRGGRVFWRDLHAVTAVWVSAFTLFLLISGLPWAKSWGNLLKQARRVTGESVVRQDWTTGRSSEMAERSEMNDAPSSEHAGHMAGGGDGTVDYTSLDRLVPTVAGLNLAEPVLISPPSRRSPRWSARSDAPNRPLRVALVLDGDAGTVLSRQDFNQRPLVDRLVGIGVAAHEGRLFGWFNQLLGLVTAVGLVTASVSAVILWWRRRPDAVLGAPPVARHRSAIPVLLGVLTVVFGLLFPLMGISLVVVLVLERVVLRHVPATRVFLGLAAPAGVASR